MGIFRNILLLIAVFCAFHRANAEFSQFEPCSVEFHKMSGGISLEEISRYKIMTWNVLNLYEFQGDYNASKKPSKSKKSEAHVREIGNIILEEMPHTAVLTEVEGLDSLVRFAEERLGGLYKPMLIPGNDGRNIHIGMLVRNDLPFEVEYSSHKDTQFQRSKRSAPQQVYFRDLPVALIRVEDNPTPLFAMGGVHGKSKRDRNNDPESVQARTLENRATRTIVGYYQDLLGVDLPLAFGGDFNGVWRRESPYQILRKDGFMRDAFDLIDPPKPPNTVPTHTYHPRGGSTKKQQLDAVVVTSPFFGLVTDARVYRYKDSKGREKPIPDSYEQRKQNPSDHFPLIVEFDFQTLLSNWRQRSSR